MGPLSPGCHRGVRLEEPADRGRPVGVRRAVLREAGEGAVDERPHLGGVRGVDAGGVPQQPVGEGHHLGGGDLGRRDPRHRVERGRHAVHAVLLDQQHRLGDRDGAVEELRLERRGFVAGDAQSARARR